MTTTLYQGHCLDVLPTLPAASVQVACTSPPFYGLRDYHTSPVRWPDGWEGQLGLEPHPALFVAHLVTVFQEVRRVLRPDGVCWVNMGDTYSRNPAKGGSGPNGKQDYMPQYGDARRQLATQERPAGAVIPEKSLLLIPQRLAIALQDDGWIVRQVFPWVKRNCMPSSQQDRATTALEWWLMLTKHPHYYSDLEAVRQPGSLLPGGNVQGAAQKYGNGSQYGPSHKTTLKTPTGSRTYRNTDLWFQSLTPPYGLVGVADELVGLDVPTKAGPSGHYATFSPELVTPLLQMSTSAKGACSQCGAPWARTVERSGGRDWRAQPITPKGVVGEMNGAGGNKRGQSSGPLSDTQTVRTTGWVPTCAHPDAATQPCVVLDPFAGRGATLLAAARLGLDGIGVELNAADVQAAKDRLEAEAPLLQRVSIPKEVVS